MKPFLLAAGDCLPPDPRGYLGRENGRVRGRSPVLGPEGLQGLRQIDRAVIERAA